MLNLLPNINLAIFEGMGKSWCKSIYLVLNTYKMKEMLIGFQRPHSKFASFCINNCGVQNMESIYFFRVQVSDHLNLVKNRVRTVK